MYFTGTHLIFTSKLRDVVQSTLFLLLLPPTIFSASLKYKTMKGRPNGKEPVGRFISTTFEVCRTDGLARFSDGKQYAASFHTKRYLCFIYEIEGKRSFTKDSKTILNKEEEWQTYLPIIEPLKPIVYWKLSKTDKGKNFGSAGDSLDLAAAAEQCDFEDDSGPKGGSDVSYCTMRREPRNHGLPLFVNDFLLFDFTRAFTIALWVKMDTYEIRCVLVGSSPLYGPYFGTGPTAAQVILDLDGKWIDPARSTLDDTDVDKWRHIAVVYKPPLGVSFYLNGNNWPLERKKTDKSRMEAPEDISLLMWKMDNGSNKFKGQMACVTIFQAPFTNSDMPQLKDFCP